MSTPATTDVLHSACAVMLTFDFQVGLMRFLRSIKPSNQRMHAVCANPRAPSLAASQLRHPQQSAGFIPCVRSFLILNVACGRYVAQIFERVVARIAVNVVYIACRPCTSHVKPRQTIGAIPFFINANNAVTFRPNVPGNGSRNNFTARFDAPSKASCFGIVAQQRAQLVKCDVKMAHATSLP